MPKINVKRHDLPPSQSVGAADIISTAESIAPPVPSDVASPVNVVVSTVSARSSQAPTSYLDTSWDAPYTPHEINEYQIRVAKLTDMSDAEIHTVKQTSARLEVAAATSYYVEVRAIVGVQYSAWVRATPAPITSANDTSPPSVPTAPALAFIGYGDAIITHTPSTSANYRDTEVKIYSQSGGTLYGTFYDATGRLVWTAAQNRAATAGAGDPSLYVEMRSRSWSNVFSTSVNTGLVTKAAPTAPTVTVDFSGPDAIYTITPPADAENISFVADTGITARLIGRVGRYVYTFDQNRLDHSGTPDPALAYSFTSIDGLGQSSTATTGTATNAVPTAPTSVSVEAGFSVLLATVVNTKPADFAAYRYRVIQTSPSTADVTVDSTDSFLNRSVTAAATYQVGVKVLDMFGQVSTETLSNTVIVDALTLVQLRAESSYIDSSNTSAATLKTAMSDDNRTTGGIDYASNAGWVRWVRFERPLLDRYRSITLSMTVSAGTAFWYIRTSKDAVTWSHFALPIAADGRTLAAVASEALARSNAVPHTSLGNPNANRADLPSITEARYVEVWISNSTGTTRVDEFYPRRLVQSDDIEAEAVRAILFGNRIMPQHPVSVGG